MLLNCSLLRAILRIPIKSVILFLLKIGLGLSMAFYTDSTVATQIQMKFEPFVRTREFKKTI